VTCRKSPKTECFPAWYTIVRIEDIILPGCYAASSCEYLLISHRRKLNFIFVVYISRLCKPLKIYIVALKWTYYESEL